MAKNKHKQLLKKLEEQYITKMKLTKISSNWWVENPDSSSPYGPYDTKIEAERDRKVLARAYATIELNND